MSAAASAIIRPARDGRTGLTWLRSPEKYSFPGIFREPTTFRDSFRIVPPIDTIFYRILPMKNQVRKVPGKIPRIARNTSCVMCESSMRGWGRFWPQWLSTCHRSSRRAGGHPAPGWAATQVFWWTDRNMASRGMAFILALAFEPQRNIRVRMNRGRQLDRLVERISGCALQKALVSSCEMLL